MRPQHITAENPHLPPSSSNFPPLPASMRPQHITAENALPARQPWRSRRSFNEAAAYHCGKQGWSSLRSASRERASMRPQHITAENAAGGGADGQGERPASMRPQHITAENTGCAAAWPSSTRASMRPQHITAENRARVVALFQRQAASMRPQHITAENKPRLWRSDRAQPRFNEAAAYHCGKRIGDGRTERSTAVLQ